MLWGLILSCLFCSNRNEPQWESGWWGDSGDFWRDSGSCDPWISLRDEGGASTDTLSFGTVGTTGEHVASVWIHNKGDCDLTVSDVDVVSGSDTFSVEALDWPVVRAGESVELPVVFEATAPGAYEGVLQIDSNDPFDDALFLGLAAELSFGGLEVDVDTLDLGTVDVGCDADAMFRVQNVGTGPVTISAVTTDSATDEFSAMSDTVPAQLESGDTLDVVIRYEPADEYADEVYVTVHSDDPSAPELLVLGSGQGAYTEHLTDTFVQEGTVRAFLLTAIPVETSLDVRVHGVLATGWSFDGSAVVFDEGNVPAVGAEIRIEYARQPACD